jgi:hypothetical protein
MGLDWILLSKPIRGNESLFYELKEKYQKEKNKIVQNEAEEAEQTINLQNINKELEEISLNPYETIGCPKVSESDVTRQYFIDNIYQYVSKEGKSIEDVLELNKDMYIVELSPEINNFPSGTASFVTSKLDFRGQIIGRSDLIDDELREEAYEDHTSEQMLEYADKLEICLNKFDREQTNEESELEDIADTIKWLRFWGSKSHGFRVWY